jgi:murein L,D-transpeptidase YcbB/YkuD
MKQVAVRWFTHLAYGNQIPKLQYDGVKFKLNTYNVSMLLEEYLTTKSLYELVQFFTNSSTEVSSLLSVLQKYRDSSRQYPEKIALLVKATNEYRWLNAIRQGNRIILVNIPSAQLRAYEGNKVALNMRVVVGKLTTPTNTLASKVEKIVVNPYWTVPKSISTKEMLPKILSDINYLSNNHLQVLNEQYKVIAPEKIDWKTYSEENFPFVIRQATGSDNSLGVLKVDFSSPFGIYLHDSPEKALFSNTNRFYSHGCMRMEKPIEMGKWLTQDNKQALDTFNFKKIAKNIPPKYISVTLPTHVIVWYSLVDFDNKGNVKFYKDWYEKK